ncbi:MAG TPA: S-layer homology domain-containing protein [Pseudoflavonifractor sp.]|nr:S-layer homology domain-containing protein [Pseudoflavonifractor sp.]
MKKRTWSKRFLSGLLVLVLALGMLPPAALAVEGTVQTISSQAELEEIGLSGSYKLTGDIVLTGEWTPIGSSTAPFTGTLDGNGYTISGLDISAGNATYQGLFAKVGTDGAIQDLTVEGTISSSQTSNAFIGGIAGQVQGGSIVNCVSKVGIDAKGNKIGGVAGDATGTSVFTGCANLGSINAKGMSGGVIGGMSGTANISIKNCYNTGMVTATGTNYGGIVGYATGTVTIENCYNADSGVRSGTNSGALVGYLSSTSTAVNSYWLGDETTVGVGNAAAPTSCSFKTEAELKAITFLDTLNQNAPEGSRFAADPGDLNGGYPVLECQLPKVEKFQVTFDLTPANAVLTVKDTAGVTQTGANGVYRLPAGEYVYSASAFGYQTANEGPFTVVDGDDPGTVTVVLAETARQTVTFSGLPQGAALTLSHAAAGQLASESDGSYRLPAGEYRYTVVAKDYEPLVDQPLTVAAQPVSETVSMTALPAAQPWDGVEKTVVTPIGGTYYIKTGAELAWFASETIGGRLLDTRIVLLADIDVGNKPWSSIGPYSKEFKGSFDGNGCVVSGIAGDCYGLFYGIAKDGIVENLIVSGSITGTSNTGGIVGVNYGTVRNCVAGVTVSADGQRVGGVAGNNSGGLISGCAALASVSSSYTTGGSGESYLVRLGGIAGQNTGVIEFSYSIAAATATGQNPNGGVGGVTGVNTGSIKSCYNIGFVSFPSGADKSTGAIVGTLTSPGSVENTFYLDSSCARGVGEGSSDGAQQKTSAEMKKYTLALALNGGSVDGPFYLAADENQNSGYPVLKWQGGRAPVASPDELAVASDKAALSLPQLVFTYARTIQLPGTGAAGSAISWESSRADVISGAGAVVLPMEANKVTVVLTATLTKGEIQDTKAFTLTVYSAAQVTRNYLEEARSSLGAPLTPVCTRDTNIVTLVEAQLADRGFADVDVALTNRGSATPSDEIYIEDSGAITYYYRNPGTTGAYNGAIVRGISFTLSKDGQSVDWGGVQANIPWDRDRVVEALREQVAEQLTWDAIKGNNSSPSEITKPLTLPIKLDTARWATISWESDSWAITPQEAGPLDDETTGVINRQSVDAQVNLTAVIRFNLTASGEADIMLSVPFDLIILGSEGADTPEKMQQKLGNYTLERLKDSITQTKLDPAAVAGDIQFPTPANTGVADYSAYRFTVTSKNTDVLEVNGYRGYIYRPLPGKAPVTVGFTVTMTSRANPALSASRDMEFTVLPLEQEEINEALRLMEAVRADYANALMGTNTDKDAITADLKTFREAVFAPDGETLVYSRKISDDTGRGVAVDDLLGSGPGGPGYEQWRTFRSSRSDILEHEVLRLHQPAYDTPVTVESCLTHEVLGKYANKYPGNRDFQALNRVDIQAQFKVTGTSGENPNPERTFQVTFSLDGRGLIESIPSVSVGELESGTTVFNVFRQVLADKGFTYEASGSYIAAVTDSEGVRLAEFDKGEDSGWMYTVDGVFPDKMMNACYLFGGESIQFLYTGNWKEEPGVGGGMAEQPASGTVLKPKVTADKDGAARAEMTEKGLASAIQAARDGKASAIVIEPSVTGKATKVTVELPKASVSAIGADTAADLTIRTPVGSVTLPNGALASAAAQAAGETVAIAVGAVDAKALTVEQQRLVGDGAVFDISITSGGKPISSFDGKQITLSLPYTLKNGESAEGVAVWHLSAEGKLTRMACAYDKATGLATFATTHLSNYVVGYDAWTNPFTDVKAGDWFYDAVKYVAEHALFNGTSATAFSPNADMTRAMLVTALYRLEGKPAVTAANPFADVEDGQWYTDAVLWASSSGIVTGYDSGLFGVDDPITREQLAVILYRYAGVKGYDVAGANDLAAYSDAGSAAPYALSALRWANAGGLVTGRTATALAPSGTATRAEVATILMRFAENVVI